MALNLNTADILMLAIAVLINLLLTILFLCRIKGFQKWEDTLGIVLIILALPVMLIAMINFFAGRTWWTYILPLPIIIFLILELFFDYIYELDFRKTGILIIIYLFFYYTGLLGLIGYVFLTNGQLAPLLLVIYFIHQLAALYAHRKK